MDGYLKERRLQLSLTLKEVATKVGVSEATVSRWEGGQIANMKRQYIAAYAAALQTTPGFIMTGKEEQETDTTRRAVSIPPGFMPLPEMAQVPLVGRIACGTPITAEQNVEQIVSIPAAWRATFTLMCKGNSMAPRIQDGDLVAVRSQPEVENGEIAAVRIGEEATLKHVYVYPNYIELRPENPEYESIIKIGPDMADVVIEGKAVGLCRGI